MSNIDGTPDSRKRTGPGDVGKHTPPTKKATAGPAQPSAPSPTSTASAISSGTGGVAVLSPVQNGSQQSGSQSAASGSNITTNPTSINAMIATGDGNAFGKHMKDWSRPGQAPIPSKSKLIFLLCNAGATGKPLAVVAIDATDDGKRLANLLLTGGGAGGESWKSGTYVTFTNLFPKEANKPLPLPKLDFGPDRKLLTDWKDAGFDIKVFGVDTDMSFARNRGDGAVPELCNAVGYTAVRLQHWCTCIC